MTIQRLQTGPQSASPIVERHKDPATGLERAFRVTRVLPGEYYVTQADDELIVTVLGSCVSACIRDPKLGIGGLNHFMLPHSQDGEWDGASRALRYGNFAMEALINDLIKLGSTRNSLEIKLFGGASFATVQSCLGTTNADFVEWYLRREGLRAVAVDMGGTMARRIHYFPVLGVAQRRFLREDTAQPVVLRDSLAQAAHSETSSDIELFEG